MSKASFLFLCLSPLLFILISSSLVNEEEKHEYIVYMGVVSRLVRPLNQHTSILQEVTGQSSIEDRYLRSYGRSFSGFVALLTESERETLASIDGVVSVFPNRQHKLHTTMSWDFMGLKEGKTSNRNPTRESDTIIGVIDSGIWPESKSFEDKGFSLPPPRWKGACEGGRNFTCNNKLIGARYYTTESARDDQGHGSHTASTAAGNAVRAVSFYGLGNGTARGGVPGARVAAYKACDIQGCTSASILSAFDDSIADHVDLITISIGVYAPFEENPIAIGAFHAMAKGILTVNSAGNDGPGPSTVSGLAPWIFTVAASNTNRAFVTKVVLGNGKIVVGRSVNSFDLNGTKYPLVYGESASTKCEDDLARFCTPGCLDSKLVKGKIVLCDSAGNTEEVQSKGAVGCIVTSSRFTDVSYIFSLPVSLLSSEDYKTVLTYMKATKRPIAAILKSQMIFTQIAPVVARFSSRGPNTLFPDILKPDITAPGVEILAAYSPEAPLTESQSDKRVVKYAVESGTSMSCPHVAGASAYIKTLHPEWSPSMIQSAIMTTAWPMSMEQGEFAYGAGHVDPIKATDPGLVYEVDKSDHINFLCGLNYTLKTLQLISGEAVTCTGKTLPKNFNYPSMTARVEARKPFQVKFSRTVRSVSMRKSTYKAEILGSNFQVRVVPEALSLSTMHQKKAFELTVSGTGPEVGKMISVHLIWSDGIHVVRSPVVIYA